MEAGVVVEVDAADETEDMDSERENDCVGMMVGEGMVMSASYAEVVSSYRDAARSVVGR